MGKEESSSELRWGSYKPFSTPNLTKKNKKPKRKAPTPNAITHCSAFGWFLLLSPIFPAQSTVGGLVLCFGLVMGKKQHLDWTSKSIISTGTERTPLLNKQVCYSFFIKFSGFALFSLLNFVLNPST